MGLTILHYNTTLSLRAPPDSVLVVENKLGAKEETCFHDERAAYFCFNGMNTFIHKVSCRLPEPGASGLAWFLQASVIINRYLQTQSSPT